LYNIEYNFSKNDKFNDVMQICIYILKLESNKYYIGKSNNPNYRISNHFNSKGSYWTKKYKPLEVVQLFNNCDNFDEDKITLQYMNHFGIKNVRGGSFSQMNLSKSTIDYINKQLNTANDRCFECGGKDHYINSCPFKKFDNGVTNIGIWNDSEDSCCTIIKNIFKKCFDDSDYEISDKTDIKYFDETEISDESVTFE